MAVTDFIAAIELGSTEITGIAGKKNADGSIRILAYASERSSDCIKKGVIYNLDKTTQCLTSVIKRLEEILQASIKKVYVGIGGQSVRTIRNTETKQLADDTKISQALIDSMMASNREYPLVDQEILAVEPQEYKIGNNQLTTEPVGIPTDRIEGHFLNIIARNSLRGNIRQCFRQAGYEVAEYLLSPMVTANVVLTASERRSGCALIDFGADTTTVSVYKNNILRHLAVIPLGSSNITKDICSLQIEEEDAEQLKLRYASACTEAAENEDALNKEYAVDGKCTIRARKLEDIVEARVKEILENVWNQIKLSEYSDKLLAGVIITGGASKLPNLDKAFAAVTQIEKIRFAPSSQIELQDDGALDKDGTHNTQIGLLNAGKENCCKINPRDQQRNFLDEMKQKEEEDRQRVEQERLKAEAAKAKAEEEARKKQLEEARKRQEEERAQKRLHECEALMEEADRLAEKKKFKEALSKAQEASNMKIAEKQEEIAALIADIEKKKSDNNPFKRWLKVIKDGADDMMKD